MNDSKVRCVECDREVEVNFSRGLRYGWPRCHGKTMHLVAGATPDMIEQATKDAVLPLAMRKAMAIDSTWRAR
jgi:Zn finger protein HypA/HybF involved in hydrogenase expression